jgi:hypothetical protein
MNYKVVYFTRTGNSRRAAEKIASKLSVKALEITDDMNWDGVAGFVKGGYYASTGRDVEINVPEGLDDADELIVVTPLWAGRPAPAINTFLKTRALDKIHLVVTSAGSNIKERSGYRSVSDIVKNKNNEDEVIGDLVKSLLLVASK